MGRTFLRIVAQSSAILTSLLFLISTTASGQSSNPFFTPPTFAANGQAVSADVNGDGKPDLIFANGALMLGKGDGTFTASSFAGPVNFTANQIAVADFNGDGKPDILAAGPLNQFSVYLGNGDGTFRGPVTTSISVPVTSFVVGDLNGDGKPDILAGQTYFGKGDGTFQAGIASGAVDSTFSDSFADFNGDGKLDLFIAGQGVQLGNGNGTFQALTAFPSGALSNSATLGDFDGDGKLDVFATGGTSANPQIQVLFGNGDGTFHAAAAQSVPANTGLSFLVAADLNGDGKADIFGANGSAAQVLVSKGDGTFTLGSFYNAPSDLTAGLPMPPVVADFNGDKKKDVAVFGIMLFGNGDGTLQGDPANPQLSGIGGVTGDFNGDNHPDLALIGSVGVNNTVTLNIWLNDGKSNFALAHSYSIALPPTQFCCETVTLSAAADVNGDGKLDLVGTLWDANGLSTLVLLGNGDGSFGAQILSVVNNVAGNIAENAFLVVGDLNNDGKADVVIATFGSGGGSFYVLLSNGDGTFGAPSSPFVGGPQGPVTLGDFNNDKKLDAAVGTSAGIGILLGNGDGTFQPTTYVTNLGCDTSCGNQLNGDFNGDGKLDMIVPSGPGYQVLLGKGDGTFNVSPLVVPNTNLQSQPPFGQVADFNGDGHLDVLSLFNPRTLSVMLGNGDGTFGKPFVFPIAGSSEAVNSDFIADFNGDQRPDIAVLLSDRVVWLFNSAAPSFSMSAGSGGTATVAAGKTASYSLSLGGTGGFSGSVALTCSGAPSGATCTISPSSVTLSGTTPATATVSVTTTAASQLLPTAFHKPIYPAHRIIWIVGSLLAAGIAVLLSFVGRPRRRFSFAFVAACCTLLLFSVSSMAGCGGGPSSGSSGGSGTGGTTGGTATGTYTITVTATAGSVTRTIKLTLIVQ